MRRICGRVLAWLVIGAAGMGCGSDPPKTSPRGDKAPPANPELTPGAVGGEKGKAAPPNRDGQKPGVY